MGWPGIDAIDVRPRVNKACREEETNELSGTIGPSPKKDWALKGSRTASPDQQAYFWWPSRGSNGISKRI